MNVITEFVAGYIWPGKPLANVAFKCYGYMTMLQSLDLTSDLKLGLYMKIPPRHLFLCQVYGTALGSITNYSLIKGVIESKRPYLDGSLIDPTAQWTGRRVEIFFSASVVFGCVSPARFFVGEYRSLYWVSSSGCHFARFVRALTLIHPSATFRASSLVRFCQSCRG